MTHSLTKSSKTHTHSTMACRYNNTHIITNRPSQQASNMSIEHSLSLLYNRHQASAAKAGFHIVLAIFVHPELQSTSRGPNMGKFTRNLFFRLLPLLQGVRMESVDCLVGCRRVVFEELVLRRPLELLSVHAATTIPALSWKRTPPVALYCCGSLVLVVCEM
jgi:hypothetical protein